MKKEIFPIRQTRDGSVYFHKEPQIRQRRDGSVYFQREPQFSRPSAKQLVALLLLIALLLLTLAIVVSSPVRAQESATATGLRVVNEMTAHANAAAAAVVTENTIRPSLWPLRGRLTGGFGDRRNPFRRRSSEFHPGLDIAAPRGTPVSVTADGMVVFTGSKKGYGQVVIVDHGADISTRYGHLSLIETTVGTLIKRGEEIGLVGSTGRSTGSHLHYEVRVDQVPVNPLTYLPTSPPEAAAKR